MRLVGSCVSGWWGVVFANKDQIVQSDIPSTRCENRVIARLVS